VAMTIVADQVRLTIRDEGRWREADEKGRRGLEIMNGIMDSVELEPTESGTTVRMVRRLDGG
jgi:anti-sigma regulatory factor (Ser/Thr protein kinase)